MSTIGFFFIFAVVSICASYENVREKLIIILQLSNAKRINCVCMLNTKKERNHKSAFYIKNVFLWKMSFRNKCKKKYMPKKNFNNILV